MFLFPVAVIPVRFRSSNLVEMVERLGGSEFVQIHPGLPNPDDDDVFGDRVCLILRTQEGSVPASNYTEPVASCTSMAVARSVIAGVDGDFTIHRVAKGDMSDEACRRVTLRERLMALPPVAAMYARHTRRARTRLPRVSKPMPATKNRP